MKHRIVAALLAAALLLGGCNGSIYPVSQSYVLSIGIDKGQQYDYRITFQIPYLSGSTSPHEDSQFAVSIEAMSIQDAINGTNISNSHNLNLNHVNFVIFGEELTRNGNINGMIASLNRYTELNWSATMLACLGSAEDFINGMNLDKESDLDSLQDNIIETGKRTGFYPNISLADAYSPALTSSHGFVCALAAKNDMAAEQSEQQKEGGGSGGGGGDGEGSSSSGEYIPALAQDDAEGQLKKLTIEHLPGELNRAGGMGSDVFGTAIFKDGAMVGQLTALDTAALLMVRNEFEQSFLIIPDPFEQRQTMAVQVRRAANTDVSVRIQDAGKPEIDVSVYLTVNSLSYGQTANYYAPDTQPELVQHTANAIKAQIMSMLENTRQYECDIYGFEQYAARSFRTNGEFHAYDWAKMFKLASINVTVEVRYNIPRFNKLKAVSE